MYIIIIIIIVVIVVVVYFVHYPVKYTYAHACAYIQPSVRL